MKVVILAGGLGTRISEETQLKPKPMVEIGGKPILWHIMKIYSAHGIHDFIICCGYKGYVIKEYFANYVLHSADVTFDLKNNRMEMHQNGTEPWRITLVNTGDSSGTGGRLRRVRPYIGDEDFCFTYGDGVSNVDITRLIAYHKGRGKLATLTTVQPPHRFGALDFDQDSIIKSFEEKPHEGGWINGGFFVLSPKVIDYIEQDEVMWEREPIQRLTREGNLSAYRHDGFWYSMDTQRDKNRLEELWNAGKAPWKIW
ncbi:MAG: glucose-1-phosphate cytidylyltransferase [Gammaproteobacteria bacterium]|nr:glucose-1-phosphate cytidylyltransferase [Gammaproteobacteria bacterium]